MRLDFEGTIWEWRGPAPFHFVSVPDEECAELLAVSPAVSYGWGMIPATVQIGATVWATALWPKDGGYVVPLKDKVRRAESLALGDVVTLVLTIAV